MSSITATRPLTKTQSQIFTPDEPRHYCGICNKAFNRRDLRDRHKRRCVKASARLPVSKRKSCLSCVRSKVRCDLGSPICSRCRERGKECLYTAAVSNKQSDIVTGGKNLEKSQLAENVSVDTLEVSREEALDGPTGVDMGATMDLAFRQLLGDNDLYFRTENQEDYMTEKDNNNISSEDNHSWDIPNTIQDLSNSDRWLQSIELSSEEFMISQPSQGLVPSSKVAELSALDFSALIALDSPIQGNFTITDAIPTTSPLSMTSSKPCHELTPHPTTTRLPTSILVSILLDIPTAMLQEYVTPPFVHHLLYPCSSPNVDNVPCPISNAFCFLKAYEAAVSSSLTFMYNVMNLERERLVQQFDENGEIISILASVHALCIYQIISFFDNTDPAQVLAAEKQNAGFLKIARELIRYYRTSAGTENLEWHEWKIQETVVRTIHVVHAINVVSMHVASRKGCYEALDDEAIFSLPLPCVAEVWRASSSVEWARARRKLGEERTMTVSELREGGTVIDEFMRKNAGDDLIRLISSCVGI